MLIGAIDIGGTKTMLGIINSDGIILSKIQFPTDTTDFNLLILFACEQLKKCVLDLGYEMKEMVGIGVSLPGMVDRERKLLVRSVYSGWQDFAVSEIIQKITGIQNVIIDNDVNACAIGEMYFGYKKTYRNYLWVTVSTGVGGALVCDGKLIRGASGCSGEIGHMKVEYEKPLPCPCGELGCLEAHGSGTAIKHYLEQEIAKSSDFANIFNRKGLTVDAAGCAVLAKENNRIAKSIYNKAACYLGRGLGYGINLINPEVVIMGGGVSSSLNIMHDVIMDTIAITVNKALLPVEVVHTKMGYNAAFLGAASLVLDNFNQ